MNDSVLCQYASLVAFAEARRIRPIRQQPSLPGQMSLPFGDDGSGSSDDGCGRQDGGRFGQGNNCQEGAGQGSQGNFTERLRKERGASATLTGPRKPEGFEKASEVTVQQPREVADAISRTGLTTKQLADMSPGAGEKGAKVMISSYGDSEEDSLQISSSIPIDPNDPNLGSAQVRVDIEKSRGDRPLRPAGDRSGVPYPEPVESELHLDLFQVSDSAKDLLARAHRASKELQSGSEISADEKAAIDRGAKLERMLGVKLLDLMTSAISAAEEAGIHSVYTYAAGSGTGATNTGDNPPIYRGYALWGRFGLDGQVGRYGRIRDALEVISMRPDHPDRDILPPEAWSTFQNMGHVMLQDLISTKKGERLWKAHGSSADLSLNLRDKKSKGYQKFQKMKQMADRARQSGQSRDFFEWLYDAEYRTDPGVFFMNVEQRGLTARQASLLAFYESRNCGTGTGGFQKGNTCAGAAAAEAAVGAAKGALTGGSVAATYTLGYPKAIAVGAAAGAAAGAVKGLYDNQMRPTRVTKAIQKVGSSDEKVASMVKELGGSPESFASTKSGREVRVVVKDSSGKKAFDIDMTKKSVVITPARASGKLSSSEIARVKKIAEENSPKEVSVVVKSQAPSYVSQLAKAGFKFAATQAGIMVATAVVPIAPALIGTVIESTTGVEIESIGKKRR